MTRPSKLFPGKFYQPNGIATVYLETWPGESSHETMKRYPLMQRDYIKDDAALFMFLKVEKRTIRNANWNWSSPNPTDYKTYYLFLVGKKVVYILKKDLRHLRRCVLNS